MRDPKPKMAQPLPHTGPHPGADGRVRMFRPEPTPPPSQLNTKPIQHLPNDFRKPQAAVADQAQAVLAKLPGPNLAREYDFNWFLTQYFNNWSPELPQPRLGCTPSDEIIAEWQTQDYIWELIVQPGDHSTEMYRLEDADTPEQRSRPHRIEPDLETAQGWREVLDFLGLSDTRDE